MKFLHTILVLSVFSFTVWGYVPYPIPVNKGGTSLATLTSNGFLTGNGTGTPTFTTPDGSTIVNSSGTLGVPNGGITGTQIASNVALSGTKATVNSKILLAQVENSPLILVRGNISSSGGASAGAGFSVVHNSTGVYTITFDTPFSSTPSVTFTGINNLVETVAIDSTLSASSVKYATTAPNGSPVDTAVCFLAIGPI